MMIDLETVKQIKKASLAERIEIIELIVQSLKNELQTGPETYYSKLKRFKVRKFDLGMEVNVDRDELYSERNS